MTLDPRLDGDKALVLGQRLTQVLEVGRKTSTYKLATLLALLDTSVETGSADPEAAHVVSIRDLADKVIGVYWRQTKPFLGIGPLRQNTQRGRGIPEMVAELRAAATNRQVRSWGSLLEDAAAERDESVLRLRDEIAVRLAEMPLTHLQILPSGATPFLYDEPWLQPNRSQSRVTLARHNWSITLLPGVGHQLVALSGLLRPVLQLAWESLVVDLNPGLERHDLSGFLFGAERSALAVLAPRLTELQNGRCFYCDRRLVPRSVHVDHVLPWARIPLDAAANLVAADSRCNLAKRDSLPVIEHHLQAVTRPPADLAEVARHVVPVLLDETRRVGRSLYRTNPAGTPLWASQASTA